MGVKLCSKCGGKHFFIKEGDPHTGLYCRECGKWDMWVPKRRIFEFKGLYPVIADREFVANVGVEKCNRCGGEEFIEKRKGIHLGVYCKSCGRWQRWKKV